MLAAVQHLLQRSAIFLLLAVLAGGSLILNAGEADATPGHGIYECGTDPVHPYQYMGSVDYIYHYHHWGDGITIQWSAQCSW